MQGIRFRVHFLTLLLATGALWLVDRLSDAVPIGDARFILLFGSMGAFHAASLVISLRDRKAATLGKAILFVTLVAVLSMVAPFSSLLSLPILSFSGNAQRLSIVLACASAFGAAGYWLLIRLFWLRSLRPITLILTVAMCAAATLLSFSAVGKMPPTSEIGQMMPVIAWWAAFSLSLYLGNLQSPIPVADTAA